MLPIRGIKDATYRRLRQFPKVCWLFQLRDIAWVVYNRRRSESEVANRCPPCMRSLGDWALSNSMRNLSHTDKVRVLRAPNSLHTSHQASAPGNVDTVHPEGTSPPVRFSITLYRNPRSRRERDGFCSSLPSPTIARCSVCCISVQRRVPVISVQPRVRVHRH